MAFFSWLKSGNKILASFLMNAVCRNSECQECISDKRMQHSRLKQITWSPPNMSYEEALYFFTWQCLLCPVSITCLKSPYRKEKYLWAALHLHCPQDANSYDAPEPWYSMLNTWGLNDVCYFPRMSILGTSTRRMRLMSSLISVRPFGRPC